MESKSRMQSLVWLAVGLVMATMYAINAIQASSAAYFVIAFGWALLGIAQWWRSRLTVAPSGTDQVARSRRQLALYLTLAAFLVIAAGLSARWWGNF